MILSMLCWGSWANTLKMCPRFRFQLYYWDYALGMAACAVFWGLTAGSLGHSGPSLGTDLARMELSPILFAVCGGVLFNVANLLLVAAIDVAGLAVAFPVGIGLALVIGAVSSYLVHPAGNPLLLFGGVALVAVAIVLDAAAYRMREATARAATTRGIVLSLVAGVLMGTFYPFVAHALNGAPDHPAPGPYAVSLFFALGLLLSTVPANLLLMARPLDGKPPVDASGYGRAPFAWHFAGILGGAIWCTGLRSSPRGSCRLLHYRPGRDHGIGLLGRLCLARVCRRASLGQASAVLHVYLLPAGLGRSRLGSALPCLRHEP